MILRRALRGCVLGLTVAAVLHLLAVAGADGLLTLLGGARRASSGLLGGLLFFGVVGILGGFSLTGAGTGSWYIASSIASTIGHTILLKPS